MRSRILFTLCFISVLVGQPSFTAHSLGTSEYIQSLLPADMDNDGDIDLLAARWTEGSAVVWYENNGSESFTMQTVSANHNYVSHAEPIDLDQDGDMDVIIGEGGSGTYDHVLTWARNNGSQSFTIITIASSLNNSNAVYPSDIDGDNDIDVLVGWKNGIRWYENNGSESFTAHTISADHSYESCLADINAWHPKIRFGGILSGHDYHNTITHSRVQCHVKKAVLDYTRNHQIAPLLIWGRGLDNFTSWAFVVSPTV